jgi:hypothetical protein
MHMSEVSQAKARPLGVTILAILAGLAAVLAAIHALQFLGLFPFVLGPRGYKVHYFSFWDALLYGILVWLYVWLTLMLWRVQSGAWMFLVIITVFYLILDGFLLLGATSWEDVSVSILLNAVILIYCMLPGVRSAFGADY